MTQDFPFITDIYPNLKGYERRDGYDLQSMRDLASDYRRGSTIIVTGMGSSGFASYAWVISPGRFASHLAGCQS